MKTLLQVFTFLFLATGSYADSGGPYEGMPDVKEAKHPIIFGLSSKYQPLDFYLKNIPSLVWNKSFNEPDSYTWLPIKGYHASFRHLGYVRGHRIMEVRYVSQIRTDQGLDYADIILILAKEQDSKPNSHQLRVIYYTTGGAVYNHTAQYDSKAHKYGAVIVTRHYSGNGSHVDKIGIRGTEDFKFERFSPTK